ncbi:MAG: hypothetical protein PVF17_09120 [Ignavibacteria bacterium]|jgi:hypothetical protein
MRPAESFILIFQISLIFFTSALSQQNINNKSNSPDIKSPYYDQKTPGMTPEIFAPGVISREGFDDYGITFSKNNDLLLYTCDTIGSNKHNIMFCVLKDGKWTAPELIPFSFTHSIGEPVFSPYSDKIFYGQLVMNANGNWEPHIYFTKKTEDGWETPSHITPGLFASETNDGTLYFTDVTRSKKPMDKSDIVKSKYVDGKYMESELLEREINTEFQEFHPFIAPDESFVIFDSDRPGGFGDYDIYISFKNNNNEWGTPINFGEEINSNEYDGVATLSTDGKYLFYCHNQDIYWVSSIIIENLKNQDLHKNQ